MNKYKPLPTHTSARTPSHEFTCIRAQQVHWLGKPARPECDQKLVPQGHGLLIFRFAHKNPRLQSHATQTQHTNTLGHTNMRLLPGLQSVQSSLSFVDSDGKPVTNETQNRSLRGVIFVSGTGLELIGFFKVHLTEISNSN